ncbi:nuclease-related domain-containing protein [Naasia sp. SYSU D00948]|uniref:nuclease-related domain-containing protein n=1 Tax=Naasia sp. SYSU D00948 TaxID=2817379 RepID=UPI001B30D11A|nr:nuclease-related domain-containing protein [Naasia sp. SYSU D00948]
MACAPEPPGASTIGAEPEQGPRTDPAGDRALAKDGIAGASAQREYERRRAAREQRVRARHPKIGGLLLALVGDPAQTKVWAQGAEGERAVGERLDWLDEAVVLNDRRVRRPNGRLSRANIDHLVITPTGVWVIDAKTHRGKLEVRRSGGLFSPRVERLFINGRDRTGLIDGVRRQVDAVAAGLRGSGFDVNVRGALCFVGTELPLIDQEIAGIAIRGRRGLLKLLRRPGPLGVAQLEQLAAQLEEHFPPA